MTHRDDIARVAASRPLGHHFHGRGGLPPQADGPPGLQEGFAAVAECPMSRQASSRAAQNRRRLHLTPLCAALALACGPLAAAEPVAGATLETVTITGNYNNAVGTSDAASQGSVTSKLIEARPALRPAEVLEFVPGVIVTQHSGDGKANQYFLRGFNLDHGTDFATYVDGVPVNMPTHAHGHGYSDLNWLIPELVERIDYRKGPYFADEGDFASAGAAHLRLANTLPQGLASVTLGEHGYRRGLLVDSKALGDGHLLYALESAHNNGPWVNPEGFHRLNGVLRYSVGGEGLTSSITATGYAAGWNATDQIPESAVATVGRFGAIDPSDGGHTSRYSLAWTLEQQREDGTVKFNAYAIRSRLQLFSNFTYFLDDHDNGDQFEQAEQRTVLGLAGSRSWNPTLGGHESTATVGLQLRNDRLSPVGLYKTVQRAYLSTTQESRVRETSLGLWTELATQWTPWLRSVAGLRADRFDFDVDSSVAGNSGSRQAGIGSPKLSLIVGPWQKTEVFFNVGEGFHSNDARGVLASSAPAGPAVPLVRSKGAEVGLRTEFVPGLQSSLSLWRLTLGSELVFVGDAGDVEASRASKRTGVEWNNHWVAKPWLLFDVDFAASRARFTEDDPNTPGRYIPGSIDQVATFGATLADLGRWSGQFQLRYFGPRPLIENNRVRSSATTLAYLRVGYKLTPDTRLALDVFNLFDRKASDIDYYYESQQTPTASPTEERHFHPVEPRALRITLTTHF
jgi:hypothetical protein